MHSQELRHNPYKSLALLPGPRQFFHNAVVTGDNQTLVTIGFNSDDTLFVTKYDILRNTWTETQTIAPSISESRQGIHPVIDPITSLIYIAAGTFLCVLDPSTVQVNQREIPPGILLSRQFGGSVYSAARKSLMYFGGLAPGLVMDPAATHITEYDIASSTWATFITPTQSGSISGNDSHNSLGPILGGVFGTLAIVALSGIVHFYLKRKQEKAKSNQSPEPERQPLQSWDSGSKPITTKMMSGVQSQQPSEFRVRNPQSAAFGGSAPRHPQDVNAMGIVIPSPQPQQPTTHVIHESMGTLVTEKVGAAPAPPFAMGMQGQPAPGTMMYVPNAGYTPVNVTTAAALPYTAPGSQVFYSTDVNGNMYSSGYQVFEPTAPAYPTNTTYASGYTTIVSDNSAHHSDEGRTSGVVGGADQRTYVPPPL
ncbi:hypothetical protein BG011_002293 [Mortierella polycephala]|uniref:Kelch repeat protein n=1 Tax=Mortierella polycephala TaxID=41804 RepID=A0A9P6U5E5_9FUNG|nr:hypothetical protein BG011_002293 [Mortierella polycephala]